MQKLLLCGVAAAQHQLKSEGAEQNPSQPSGLKISKGINSSTPTTGKPWYGTGACLHRWLALVPKCYQKGQMAGCLLLGEVALYTQIYPINAGPPLSQEGPLILLLSKTVIILVILVNKYPFTNMY